MNTSPPAIAFHTSDHRSRRFSRSLIAALATFAILLASGIGAEAAHAGRYYFCGVQKSGQSWCPQLGQSGIERHSFEYVYTWDGDLGSSRCAGHRMAAFVGYPSGDASSPKYDRNSNTCNEGYYDIHNNTEYLRVYGMHFHTYQVKFSGWGDY